MSTAALGSLGEDAAVEFLTARGLVVLARNWRCRHGEIDVIARDGETIAFVEVKTRSSTRFGTAEAAVTPAKQRTLRRLASLWLAANPQHRGSVRFDVVGVAVNWGCGPTLTHTREAF